MIFNYGLQFLMGKIKPRHTILLFEYVLLENMSHYGSSMRCE